MKHKVPVFSCIVMVILGLAPTVLVTQYYDIIPNRTVIQWDVLGRMTVIGTRASSVLLVANFAALAGLAGAFLALWRHQALAAAQSLRPFLILNLSQIVAINLTCIMLVTQALGLKLAIKPMILPAMAVLLFAAGVLLWRAEGVQRFSVTRAAGVLLGGAGCGLLVFNGFASPQVVGYYATAFALLAMAAAALPARAG
ncbi:MAG: hypothetical protein KJS87_01590 [Alphaproteobacteria bacterium]|nr:hypothetical protein [Alphaproteobacteria bacterium]